MVHNEVLLEPDDIELPEPFKFSKRPLHYCKIAKLINRYYLASLNEGRAEQEECMIRELKFLGYYQGYVNRFKGTR